jgi:hypothetical protein
VSSSGLVGASHAGSLLALLSVDREIPGQVNQTTIDDTYTVNVPFNAVGPCASRPSMSTRAMPRYRPVPRMSSTSPDSPGAGRVIWLTVEVALAVASAHRLPALWDASGELPRLAGRPAPTNRGP